MIVKVVLHCNVLCVTVDQQFVPVSQSNDANVVEQSVTKETAVTAPNFEVGLALR